MPNLKELMCDNCKNKGKCNSDAYMCKYYPHWIPSYNLSYEPIKEGE